MMFKDVLTNVIWNGEMPDPPTMWEYSLLFPLFKDIISDYVNNLNNKIRQKDMEFNTGIIDLEENYSICLAKIITTSLAQPNVDETKELLDKICKKYTTENQTIIASTRNGLAFGIYDTEKEKGIAYIMKIHTHPAVYIFDSGNIEELDSILENHKP